MVGNALPPVFFVHDHTVNIAYATVLPLYCDEASALSGIVLMNEKLHHAYDTQGPQGSAVAVQHVFETRNVWSEDVKCCC